MEKNLIPGPIFTRLAQMQAYKICSWVLPLLVVRYYSKLYPIQFPGKLMNQILENGKKTSFSAQFWLVWPTQFFLRVLPTLVVRDYFKLSFYAISRKTGLVH